MGFPSPLTSPQIVTARASGYWSRTFIAFNPGEIVFQCESDAEITDAPFKTFAWTNTLEGDYLDVWQGMVVYISSTTDYLKNFKYRGRVRLAPDADDFFIDLNATSLEAGDIITVTRDADLFARVREVDLVDGSVAYHNLPPMTYGLPSVLVLYDSDNDGDVFWTPDQVGIPTADGAAIDTYAWAVSGNGAFSISDDTAQNPDFTFEAGFHYLVKLVTTDDNGVSNFILVQVYAISRTFTAPVILPAVAGNVSQNLDDGFTGSITAYGGVSNLPYRTHAVIFCVEHFGDNSSTPIVTNILMHGRLRSESIQTEGSAEAGQLQQVTYPIEGMTSYLQRLKVPNDMVRQSASPSAWGEMTDPNPYRMSVYFLFAYTTLLNLVSFSAGDSLFEAWKAGGKPVSVDGGYALDTLNNLLGKVDAAPNYAPTGEIYAEINASYKVDRSGLFTIMDFTLRDVQSLTLDIDTSRITGQVTGYGGMWNSVANDFILFTSFAPTIPYSDAPESRELTQVLLQADQTTGQASAELEARTGNDYAFHNPKWLVNVALLDSHRWLVATNYQRYTFTVAASDNTRGIALTTATKFQCQSVDITINPDGTYDVSAQFPQETEFADAQSVASLLPINLSDMNPVLPVLSDDLAFPDDPGWMFPTDTPTPAEYPAIDPASAYSAYSPFTPDQAAAAAEQQGTANCRPLQVNFRNPGTVQTTWNTVLGAGYTITVKGDAQIAANTWLHTFNFRTGDGGWVANTGFTGATYVPGTGWVTVDALQGGFYRRGWDIELTGIASTEFTGFSATYDYTQGVWSETGGAFTALIGATPLWDIADTFMVDGAGLEQGWAGSITATGLRIAINTSLNTANTYSGASTLRSITVTGTGTNPFTSEPGGVVRGDAFYYGYNEEAGGEAQVYGDQQGLRINSTPITPVPEYSENHSYSFPYTGDANPVVANFADTTFTDNDNRLLYLTICRNPS